MSLLRPPAVSVLGAYGRPLTLWPEKGVVLELQVLKVHVPFGAHFKTVYEVVLLWLLDLG